MTIIEEAHEILGALLHASVGRDPLSSPNGFMDARVMGLLDNGNHLTRSGEAVLVLLGVKQIDKTNGGN